MKQYTIVERTLGAEMTDAAGNTIWTRCIEDAIIEACGYGPDQLDYEITPHAGYITLTVYPV